MKKWFNLITLNVFFLTIYKSSYSFPFGRFINKSQSFFCRQNRLTNSYGPYTLLSKNSFLGCSLFIKSGKKSLNSNNKGIVENTSEDVSLIRNIAADTLFQIFFLFEAKNQVDTEKALKKSLRRLQSHLNEINKVHPKEMNYNSRMRHRLSEIVLGISVMRVRYWFLVIKGKSNTEERNYLLQNPIIGTEQLAELFLFNQIQLEDNEPSLLSLQQQNRMRYKNSDKFTQTMMQMIYEMIDLQEIEKKQTEIDESFPNDSKYSLLHLGIQTTTDLPPNQVKAIQLSIEESLPLFLSNIFISQYGFTDACKLAQISNKPGPITLRRNPLQCSSNDQLCLRLLQDNNILATSINMNTHPTDPSKMTKSKLDCKKNDQFLSTDTKYALRIQSQRPKSIWNIEAWKDGQFEVQDLGSQLIIQAIELENLFANEANNEINISDETHVHVPDKLIVDFCAGNGGKTLAMASIIAAQEHSDNQFKPRTQIIAHDINPDRLKQIMGSLSRIGLKNQMNDKNASVTIETTTNAKKDIPCGSADVVLVDAPCSSVGVLRRRPGQRWILTEEEMITDLPKVQLDILQQAARIVKKGGILIYATCSISCFENEHIALEFENLPDFNEKWVNWNFEEMNLNPSKLVHKNSNELKKYSPLNERNEKCSEGKNWRAILPHVHDADGFFIARWKRRQ